MKHSLAGLAIVATVAAASCASAATTIEAGNFNLSYTGGGSTGSFDMSLLSSENGTVRIGLDTGLQGYSEATEGAPVGNGDYAGHYFAATVGQGYRVTSITLTADVTGQLYVETPPPCPSCGSSTPGIATNEVRVSMVASQGGSWVPHATSVRNVVGTQQLALASTAPMAGTFELFLELLDGVDARGWYVLGYGTDHEPPEYYYDALASIDVSNVVLTVQLAPVPEPSTYAMLLAGLGVAGWTARRRRG